MPEPTRQEIINAHEALSNLAAFASRYTEDMVEMNQTLGWNEMIKAALPPKPQPTMAEVKWDDDKHYLAEAEHLQFGKVIMLYKNPAADSIEVIYKNQDGITPSITYPGALTPTGRRYTLTEVQE